MRLSVRISVIPFKAKTCAVNIRILANEAIAEVKRISNDDA